MSDSLQCREVDERPSWLSGNSDCGEGTMPPSAAWNTQRQTERARTPKASAREECLEKTQAECEMSTRMEGGETEQCRECAER